MKKNLRFDHLIGEEKNQYSEQDLKIYRNIIKAHSKNQSIEEQRSIKHMSVRLEMEDYIKSSDPKLKVTGSFLEKLLKIYDVKKSQFAKFIELERPNFYALLKGRRKLNSIIEVKVSETFNIDPELWLFIEAKNEIKAHQCLFHEDKAEYKLSNLLNER